MISLTSIALGTFLAFVAGIARTSGNRIISALAFVYVDVVPRHARSLVQLFWFYYALPLVGISFDPVTTGIAAWRSHRRLRGGGRARRASRGAAVSSTRRPARSISGTSHTLWHISMPQAIVEMMPAFGNLAIQNLKDTALVSLISIADLTFQAQSLAQYHPGQRHDLHADARRLLHHRAGV